MSCLVCYITIMQIICKYKDFYDYKCHEYGRDPFPTFDRRGSLKLTQASLMEWLISIDKKRDEKRFWEYINDEEKQFYLEIGYDKYIFIASNFTRKPVDPKTDIYEYNCDIRLARVINSDKKIWPATIVLSRLEVKLTRDWNYWKNRQFNIETCDERDINYGNERGYIANYNKDNIVNLPILAETKLAGLLNPHDVYVSLDTYLRSLHNDVNQESEGLTDKEKAVNKGFNARESFRNVFPRG